MPAPPSTMDVSNTSTTDSFWCNGVQIAPQSNHTFTTNQIAGVCSDINFWAVFLSGTATVQINGFGLPSTTPAVVAFLIAVAIGDIVPT